jgi:hypothetical protein
MMDNTLQPRRTTRPDRDNISGPLGENPPAAMRHLTNKPSRDHSEAHLSAGAGQIGADSDEVARVKRDEAARDSWMMAPAVTE